MPRPKLKELEQLSDNALITGYQETGQQVYISLLYRRYEHLVYGSCLKYLKNSHDIEDMVGEVFEKVMLKLRTTNVKSFADWVFIITRNACLSKLRKKKIEYSSSDNWDEIERKSDEFMENEGLARLMNSEPSNRRISLVKDALAELSEEQRHCVQLFFFDSQSYREIEATTGYPLKKVKSLLQNGKRNLRIILSKKIAVIIYWLTFLLNF